jgi:hypothetical protein
MHACSAYTGDCVSEFVFRECKAVKRVCAVVVLFHCIQHVLFVLPQLSAYNCTTIFGV